MKMATIKLTSHPAYGVVSKKSIGIQFWISGDPAEVIVNVTDPKAIAAGMNRRGISACLNKLSAIGKTEKATMNRLTPPYVKTAQAATTATSAKRTPILSTIHFDTLSAAPLSSMTFPKMAPAKNMSHQEEINFVKAVI